MRCEQTARVLLLPEVVQNEGSHAIPEILIGGSGFSCC